VWELGISSLSLSLSLGRSVGIGKETSKAVKGGERWDEPLPDNRLLGDPWRLSVGSKSASAEWRSSREARTRIVVGGEPLTDSEEEEESDEDDVEADTLSFIVESELLLVGVCEAAAEGTAGGPEAPAAEIEFRLETCGEETELVCEMDIVGAVGVIVLLLVLLCKAGEGESSVSGSAESCFASGVLRFIGLELRSAGCRSSK